MSHARAMALGGVLLTLAGAGCGGDSSGPSPVFQLVEVTNGALVISCGVLNHLASPDSIYFYAHLVNTTDEDVSVSDVGSVGTIIHASDDGIIGQGANNFAGLTFRPTPALIRAHDGDLTVTIVLPTTPLCAATNNPVLTFKDATTSLRINTSAGLFTSLPVTMHVNYVGGMGNPMGIREGH